MDSPFVELMDIWMASSFGLVWVKLLWTLQYSSLYLTCFNFSCKMWWSLISKLEGQVWSKESGDICRPTFVLPKVEVHLYHRRANQHSCSSAVCYETHKTFCSTANTINTLSKQWLNLIMHFSCLGYEFRMNLTVLRFFCTNLTGLFTISDT